MVNKIGGPRGSRTPGLLIANQALSQLSYRPKWEAVGLSDLGAILPLPGILRMAVNTDLRKKKDLW